MVRSVAGGVVLAAALAVPTAAQGPPPGSLAPAGQKVEGRSYAQWERSFYRWFVSHHLPNAKRASTPCTRSGQSGPVWFLGHQYAANRITCAIPAGRYVMFGLPAVDCSTVEKAPFFARTDRGLRRCAAREFKRYFQYARLSVDGTALNPSTVRATTSAFAFTEPSRPNYFSSRRRHGRTAVVAAAAILTPLTAGPHTLTLTEKFRGSKEETVVYEITAG